MSFDNIWCSFKNDLLQFNSQKISELQNVCNKAIYILRVLFHLEHCNRTNSKKHCTTEEIPNHFTTERMPRNLALQRQFEEILHYTEGILRNTTLKREFQKNTTL